MRQRLVLTSTLMAVVLYAAIDFAALWAVFAWGSLLGLAIFPVHVIVPLLAGIWWLVTHFDRNTLYLEYTTTRIV
jgi:hypothetical protein